MRLSKRNALSVQFEWFYMRCFLSFHLNVKEEKSMTMRIVRCHWLLLKKKMNC